MKQQKHNVHIPAFPVGSVVASPSDHVGGTVVYSDKYWTVFDNGNMTFCCMTKTLCSSTIIVPDRGAYFGGEEGPLQRRPYIFDDLPSLHGDQGVEHLKRFMEMSSKTRTHNEKQEDK